MSSDKHEIEVAYFRIIFIAWFDIIMLNRFY